MARDGVDGGLNRYLREIQKYPILSAEEETRLVKRWRDHGDIDASDRLVTSHLRLVVKIAMRYRGYGLPISDLVSEGQVGIMRAVKRFEPDRECRLATYAAWWIRAAIQEYILHSWSLVKMGTTAAHKKLFFNLRAVRARLQAMEEGDLSQEQVTKIAAALSVREPEVIRMSGWVSGRDQSLNTPVHEDGSGEWQDQLVDDRANQESLLAERQELGHRQRILGNALKTLSERERQIVTARRLTERPRKLQEFAVEYGISRERVRQIEFRAVQKLQRAAALAAV